MNDASASARRATVWDAAGVRSGMRAGPATNHKASCLERSAAGLRLARTTWGVDDVRRAEARAKTPPRALDGP
eukprot:8257757-Alexandrium_andersonii.AAC.1